MDTQTLLSNAYAKAWRWINDKGETFYFPTEARALHVKSKNGGKVLPPLNKEKLK